MCVRKDKKTNILGRYRFSMSGYVHCQGIGSEFQVFADSTSVLALDLTEEILKIFYKYSDLKIMMIIAMHELQLAKDIVDYIVQK